MRTAPLALLGVLLLAAVGVVRAEPQPTLLDKSRDKIVSTTNALVERVDNLFAHPRVDSDSAESRMRLRQTAVVSQRDPVDHDTRLNVRLHLPNLSERMSLYFSGNEEIDSVDHGRDQILNSEDSDALNNPTFGLRYLYKRSEAFTTSFSAGVRANNPSFNLGPRFHYTHALGKKWRGDYSQRILWDTQDEWESRTRFEFSRAYSETLLFRQTLRADWRQSRQDEEGTRLTTRTQYLSTRSERSALVYEYAGRYHTRPHHSWDRHTLAVRYRRLVYADWVALEITPFVAFADEHNWHPNPGMQFTLDMRFQERKTEAR